MVAFNIALFSTGWEHIIMRWKSHRSQKKQLNLSNGMPPVSVSLAAIAAYHIEYTLSFLFIGLVKPITYGICDAIRRLGIIIAGQRMFGGDKFTTLNLSGIALALLGALSYSLSKQK